LAEHKTTHPEIDAIVMRELKIGKNAPIGESFDSAEAMLQAANPIVRKLNNMRRTKIRK
jgi:hypothetical protein